MAPQPPSPRQYLEQRIPHMGLVRYISNKRRRAIELHTLNEYTTFEDLTQDALLRCVRKQEKYDPTRGALSTFFGYQILGAMTAQNKRRRTEKKYLQRIKPVDFEALPNPEHFLSDDDIDDDEITNRTKLDFLISQATYFDPVWQNLLNAILHQTVHLQIMAQRIGICRRMLGTTQAELTSIFRTLWENYPRIRFPTRRKLSQETQELIVRQIKKEMRLLPGKETEMRTFLLYYSGDLPKPSHKETLAIRRFVRQFIADDAYRTLFKKVLLENRKPHE